MEQAIEAFDWKRMLIGDASPVFLLEILVRTVIIYVYTLVLLRWLGSRTIGQLSTIEFLLVIALGSAVGDAMFYPEVPLLHALLVITIVVVANKGLDTVIGRSKRAERIIDGIPQEAIRDGVLNRRFMKGDKLSRSELFQQLREQGVEHLGQVASAYLETDGGLTVFKAKDPRPGLPITPPWEIVEPPKVTPDRDSISPAACERCGQIVTTSTDICPHCKHNVWIQARE